MLALLPPSTASANAAVISNVSKNSRGSISPDHTIGWDFQLTREVEVTHLGFFDMLETEEGSVGDGLFEPHQIGIWTEDGALVVSGTVSAGVEAEEIGGFRYTPISPVTLLPATTYLIGAHFGSGCSILIGGRGDCIVHFTRASFLYPANFSHDDILVRGGQWRHSEGFSAPLGVSPTFTEGYGATFQFIPGSETGPDPDPNPGSGSGPAILEDPAGDVFFFDGPLPPGPLQAPDILEVAAGYTEKELVVTLTFAAGTMQPGVVGTFYILGLDTDFALHTGGSFIPGADYHIPFATDLTFATICEESLTPATCGSQIPVVTSGDSMQVIVPLGAEGIDDDGVVRFGFVAGLFMDGAPATEDGAFDGDSGSLERKLTMASRAIESSSVPVPEPAGPLGAAASVLAVAWAARRRHRPRPFLV